MSEVTVFDTNSLAQKVRERIEGQIFDLFPTETLNLMVDSAVKRFTTGVYSAQSSSFKSPLETLIDNYITERMDKEIRKRLDESFDYHGAANEALTLLIKKVVAEPESINMLLSSLTANLLNTVKMNLHNSRFG
jgi:hypothetical protein